MHNQENTDTQPTTKPSQAEGDRDTDISEGASGSSTANDGSDQTVDPQPTSKPSQAEGDRETIEADLKEQ
jgi:hypothetical protein